MLKILYSTVSPKSKTTCDRREILISFDLTPHFEQYPYDLTYVKCGSLVFALPIEAEKTMYEYEKDGVERKFPYCDYELMPKGDWNYGFSDTVLKVETKAISNIPFSESMPPVVIKAKMQKIDWGLEDGYETVCAKTPQSRTPVSDIEEIKLIPYGCTKLRMTILPFVK